MKTIQHFVDGKNFSGDSKRTSKVFNPATGEQSAEVKLASTKDVFDAVSNAQKALNPGLINHHSKGQGLCLGLKNLLKKTLMS